MIRAGRATNPWLPLVRDTKHCGELVKTEAGQLMGSEAETEMQVSWIVPLKKTTSHAPSPRLTSFPSRQGIRIGCADRDVKPIEFYLDSRSFTAWQLMGRVGEQVRLKLVKTPKRKVVAPSGAVGSLKANRHATSLGPGHHRRQKLGAGGRSGRPGRWRRWGGYRVR